MSFRRENITPRNMFYFLQGNVRKITGKEVDYSSKIEACPKCWENGECLKCGCAIEEMFLSDKPCPDGKF